MSTYLLVHGAWHSGRCWDRVVPMLEAAGHRVIAPSLTGYGDTAHLLGPEVGLDTHVADVVSLIEHEDLTEVVLVGHSYAGLVISSVANAVPDRIAHLVYLDAMVPQDGETAVDVMPANQHAIDQAHSSASGWQVPPMPELPHPHPQHHQPDGIVHRRVPAIQPNGKPSQVWELPTGHDCMITMPGELSVLLLELSS